MLSGPTNPAAPGTPSLPWDPQPPLGPPASPGTLCCVYPYFGLEASLGGMALASSPKLELQGGSPHAFHRTPLYPAVDLLHERPACDRCHLQHLIHPSRHLCSSCLTAVRLIHSQEPWSKMSPSSREFKSGVAVGQPEAATQQSMESQACSLDPQEPAPQGPPVFGETSGMGTTLH